MLTFGEGKGPRRFLGIDASSWALGLVGFLGVMAFAVVVAVRSDSGNGINDDPADCDGEMVVYQIASSGSYNVTMRNTSGGTEQFSHDGNFTEQFPCAPPGGPLYIAAQMNGTGKVTCVILRDSAVVASATSDGQSVIAQCSD